MDLHLDEERITPEACHILPHSCHIPTAFVLPFAYLHPNPSVVPPSPLSCPNPPFPPVVPPSYSRVSRVSIFPPPRSLLPHTLVSQSSHPPLGRPCLATLVPPTVSCLPHHSLPFSLVHASLTGLVPPPLHASLTGLVPPPLHASLTAHVCTARKQAALDGGYDGVPYGDPPGFADTDAADTDAGYGSYSDGYDGNYSGGERGGGERRGAPVAPLDGERLPVPLAVRFLQRKVKLAGSGDRAAEAGLQWRLLESLLLAVAGDEPLRASTVVKAVARLAAALRSLREMDGGAAGALSRVSRALSGAAGFAAASKEAKALESASAPGCVPASSVAPLLERRVPALASTGDKVLAVLWLLYHCPNATAPGLVPVKEMFKVGGGKGGL
eukprot:187711-Chlamydomonas_euryale.AAC.1